VLVIALLVGTVIFVHNSSNNAGTAPTTFRATTKPPATTTSNPLPPPASTQLPAPASTSPEAAARPVFAASPISLPFNNLSTPEGLALDSVGNLYVADVARVSKLSPGSTTPTALPFTGLSSPCAVQVDAKGNVYVLDGCSYAGSTLLKLAAGSISPIALSPNLPAGCWNLATDSTGNLYCVAFNHQGVWVLKLAPGSTTPTQLPYDGLEYPEVIAVDKSDNVYIAGHPGAVIKLAPGSSRPSTLPPPDLTTIVW
jgi:serine/threonine-protein kinase